MRNHIDGSKQSLWKRMRDNKECYILMFPFMLFFFIFTLLPVIISIILGFTNYNMLQPPTFAGWSNYIRMFLEDSVFPIAVRNTLIFACITGPIGYLLCFILAWFISDLPRRTRAVATTIFYAPTISGQAYTVWLFLFSSDSYGIINGWLMKIGLIQDPIAWLADPVYNMKVLIIVQLWLSLGTGFLAFIAGLQGVDRTLFEAGVIDGVSNRFQELWYITLPTMKPQLIFGAVMQLVSSFSVADISIRLCGFPSTEYSAETIVTHIMDFGSIRYEMGYACAMAAVLFAIMVLVNQLINVLFKKIGE